MIRLKATGSRIVIETHQSPAGASWRVSKLGHDLVAIDADDYSTIQVAAARPLSVLRLLIENRAFWPGLSIGMHAWAFLYLQLSYEALPWPFRLAACVAFVVHAGCMWPLVEAYRGRMDAQEAAQVIQIQLDGLKVRHKIATGVDA